jgi:hypothetical protein
MGLAFFIVYLSLACRLINYHVRAEHLNLDFLTEAQT